MGSYMWDRLELFTRREIERQEWRGGDETAVKVCGCEPRGDSWWLCQYHEGVDDGAEAVGLEVERLNAVLAAQDQQRVDLVGALGRAHRRREKAEVREGALRLMLVERDAEVEFLRRGVWGESFGS